MSFNQIILLGIIQGLTEFLPISSSGHLVLLPVLFGWDDQGLLMDVALHLGTLGAILVYFRQDVGRLWGGFFSLLHGQKTAATHLLICLVCATLPLVFFGYLVDRYFSFRDVHLMGWASIIFGVILYVADRWGRSAYRLDALSPSQAFFVWGLAQIFSLIPGASRSGVCITAGRFAGYGRVEAARFAFLMAIPAIGAAATLKGYHLYQDLDLHLLKQALWGSCIAFSVGLCTIFFLMRWLRVFSFFPFVIYRVILGVILLCL